MKRYLTWKEPEVILVSYVSSCRKAEDGIDHKRERSNKPVRRRPQVGQPGTPLAQEYEEIYETRRSREY